MKTPEDGPPKGLGSHVQRPRAQSGPADTQTSVEGARPGSRAPSRLPCKLNAPSPFDGGRVSCARRRAGGDATHLSAVRLLCSDSGGDALS